MPYLNDWLPITPYKQMVHFKYTMYHVRNNYHCFCVLGSNVGATYTKKDEVKPNGATGGGTSAVSGSAQRTKMSMCLLGLIQLACSIIIVCAMGSLYIHVALVASFKMVFVLIVDWCS